MANPWNGKLVLQAFWWNCWNQEYPADWYTFLAKLAPRLAAMGFDGIWTPPPCKDTSAINNMGYSPYDYYDLGSKFQNGATGTRFGTQDSLLRMIAVAHANGLEVYPDIVLDHCDGGAPDPSAPEGWNDTRYAFAGFGGPETGRWPRSWLDFHANPVHSALSGDWSVSSFGDDICYQGSCSDTGSADGNCYMRRQARAWLTWFVGQTGVDGFRFDDVKGYPPEVVEDLLYNAMGERRDYFCVGELVTGESSEADDWASATLNRAGTFDYPFRDALYDLVASNGYFDVGTLPGKQQQNRFKTVPFVNNHDVYAGAYWDSSNANASDHTGHAQNGDEHTGGSIDPDNPRAQLAYALACTVDGSPQLFYDDLFLNFPPQRGSTAADALPTRPYLENLAWCHQKLAFKSGDYFVRYQGSQQLLILERGARAIVAINNDGGAWHAAWIATAFMPGTRLHDYSGGRPDELEVNGDGWVEIAVPPLSYAVWGPAGVAGGFSPASRRTVQQFEMDDDLGDSQPGGSGYGGKLQPGTYRTAGAIWPAAGSSVSVEVYSDSPQQVDVQIKVPGSVLPVEGCGRASAQQSFSLSFAVAAEGWHLLTARLAAAGAPAARVYVKVEYLGPAESTLF
ncbi:MAG TPA: alpha-amylase domain-containing protein [Acidobacteriaceae bacterium]